MKPGRIEIGAIRPGRYAKFELRLCEEFRRGEWRINARIGAAPDSRAVDDPLAAVAKGDSQLEIGEHRYRLNAPGGGGNYTSG